MRRLIVLSIVGIMSCVSDFGPEEFPPDYSFDIQLNCFCVPAGVTHIVVRNGMVEDYANDDFPIISDNLVETFTIPQLSEQVDEFLSRELYFQEVSYHPKYNFPEKVYIDVDENIADEEWGYEITNFQVE